MLVLGIETSCDETSAAIVDESGTIIAQSLTSQIEDHRPFGGVVPEIAARRHLDCLDWQIHECLKLANCPLDKITAIAATAGPGLIGGVAVGVMTAKAIAFARDVPFLAINHLEGHALSPMLASDLGFPYLLLLVSGGHCQFVLCKGVGDYEILGQTRDDAVGEAFDKAARLLGLPYPGGPAIEMAARNGDAHKIALPTPMTNKAGCDMSFSGLKSALARHVSAHSTINQQTQADLAASFQRTAIDVLIARTNNAIVMTKTRTPTKHMALAGGVAANQALRIRMDELAQSHAMKLYVPEQALCTDNAAMIAWAGVLRAQNGQSDLQSFAPRPRWPLAEL